jgi:hypothetical protein
MATTVKFRGPMLFDTAATNPRTLERVLVPDAELKAPSYHVDRTAAARHFAGILMRTVAGEVRLPLHGTTLRVVADDDSGACEYASSDANGLPSIDELTAGHLQLIADATLLQSRLSSVVKCEGGRIGGDKASGKQFHFHNTFRSDAPNKKNIPLTMAWAPRGNGGATVHVTRKGITTTYRLADGSTSYIYNFDDDDPSEAALEREGAEDGAQDERLFVDQDFKWVYFLMEPRKGSWDDFLMDERLPAPLVRWKFAPRSPDVSSCFGAECCGS